MKKFVLLIEFPNGDVVLCKGKDISYIRADENNEDLLHTIGLKLIEDRLIVGYQLAQLHGLPIKVDR